MAYELPPPNRSPQLLDRTASLLLVVDMQQRLMPLIDGQATIGWNAGRLLQAAKLLKVPCEVTEQYPEKLGPTIAALTELIPAAHTKRMFSCRECARPLAAHRQEGREQIVLCGIESHVCIMQTALDLSSDQWQVFLAVDAVGSRFRVDHEVALRRMESHGVVLTTTESILFEWCETSTAPEFRGISELIRQSRPN